MATKKSKEFDKSVQVGVICKLVAQGKSMRAACELASVAESTFRSWKEESEEILAQYARACEERANFWAEEIVEISDDTSSDVSGELKMPNSVAVQRAKLRVDTRKWIMARILPKKYGDKVQNEITGKDGAPIEAAITVTFVKSANGS